MGINTIVCMFLCDGKQAGQIIKTPYLFYSITKINMIQTQDTIQGYTNKEHDHCVGQSK